MDTVRLTIGGMHCDGCVRRVKAVLGRTPGVEAREVAVGSAVVALDPARATEAAVVAALEQAGFRATAGERHVDR